jgi:DNA-directed RNA polymerase subunit beta
LEEENFRIAHAATPYDKDGNITVNEVEVRINGRPAMATKKEIDYIDVASNQAFSIATSLIPFVNHDDANRALMGSNMQKQATPCLVPEAPFVATGIEAKAVLDTGRLVIAPEDGEITHVDAKKIVVCKPLLYMNLSGGPVQHVARFYKIEPENILVIHDEIDFETARLALKK